MFKENQEESQDVICDQCKKLIGDADAISDNFGVLNCIELRLPDRTIHHFCEEKCLEAFYEIRFKGFKD